MNYEDILNSISSSVAQEDIQEYIDKISTTLILAQKISLLILILRIYQKIYFLKKSPLT